MTLTRHDAQRLNEDALVGRDDRGNTVVHIAGLLVEVRVKADGRLRVWIEEDDDTEDRPLQHGDEQLLACQLGTFDAVAFETDAQGQPTST